MSHFSMASHPWHYLFLTSYSGLGNCILCIFTTNKGMTHLFFNYLLKEGQKVPSVYPWRGQLWTSALNVMRIEKRATFYQLVITNQYHSQETDRLIIFMESKWRNERRYTLAHMSWRQEFFFTYSIPTISCMHSALEEEAGRNCTLYKAGRVILTNIVQNIARLRSKPKQPVTGT